MLTESKSRFIEMFGDPINNEMGWDAVKLSDITIMIRNGKTPTGSSKYSENGTPFLTSSSVWNNRIIFENALYVDDRTHQDIKEATIKKGDILITKTGRINTKDSSLGRVAMFRDDSTVDVSSEIYIIRLQDNVSNEFILRQLLMDRYLHHIKSISKGGIDKRHIYQEEVKDLQLILPPLELQIVFAKFAEQVDKSKVIWESTKSRFIEMFGTLYDPKVPFKQLGDVATYVNGYAFKPSDWGTEGLPIIRIQNLSGSGDSFNYYSGTYPENIVINKGDVMISWSATLGVYVWNGPKALLNQHIFKVYFDKMDVNPTYFHIAVKPALEYSSSQVHGSTMTHLTKKTFDAIKIAMPPIDLQNQFAAFVEQIDKSKVEALFTILLINIYTITQTWYDG